jgi:hypothetical protein
MARAGVPVIVIQHQLGHSVEAVRAIPLDRAAGGYARQDEMHP